jgi:hypothetical protein
MKITVQLIHTKSALGIKRLGPIIFDFPEPLWELAIAEPSWELASALCKASQ